MQRAKTVSDAGYGGMLRLDESVWSVNVTDDDLLARYVDRRTGAEAAPAPVFAQIREDLLRRNARVLLTGQKGSGKSTELRRLLADRDVAGRFECVTMIVSRWVAQGQDVDMRFVLLSLAAALAEHITWRRYEEAAGWPAAAAALVEGNRDLLRELGVPPWRAGAAFTGDFAAPFVKTLLHLRDDDSRRRLLAAPVFAVPQLVGLCVELLALIEKGAGREVLLVVDDGDKLARDELARSVFVEHGEVWLRFPCRTVVTFPYWLHFEPAFLPIAVQCQPQLLENVKVIHRGAPEAALPEAVDFFARLLDGALEAPSALVDDDALVEAVRLGAGIPREFLRVLERGFRYADDVNEAKLTARTMGLAARELRNELIRMTQNEPVRRALIRVRLTKELRTHDDWRLLDQLLVIENRNDRPWYDVHPLLAAEADALGREYARRLGRDGALASEAEVLRFLDGSER